MREAINAELDRVVTKTLIGEDGNPIKVKMPRYREMAISQVDNACGDEPHSVSAFRAIREIVEPTEEEERGSSDRELTRLVVQFLMERKANAQEI